MLLSREVDLVKAALLYADEIELVSLAAAALDRALKMAVVDDEGLLRLVGNMDSQRSDGRSFLDSYTAMRKIAQVDPNELFIYTGHRADRELLRAARERTANIDRSMNEIRQIVQRTLDQTGAAALEPAYRAGILKLSDSGMQADERVTEAIPGWLITIMGLLEDPRSHLLFDEQVRALVGEMVEAGLVVPNRLVESHAGQVALGSGFIARLPAFPTAPIDELLDLRKDAEVYLSRYRRGVATMAERLSSRPFDKELGAEVDDLWRQDVAPALDEIRHGLADHALVGELARQVSTDVKALVFGGGSSPAIFLGLDSMTHLGAILSALAAAGPAAATLTQQTAKAYFRGKDERAQLEKHDLFYLYDLGNRMQ